MARSYDVDAAAFALDVDPKWLDNVLSRHDVPGVTRQKQGVTRAISAPALLHLAIVRALTEAARLPTSTAVHLSVVLLGGRAGASDSSIAEAPLAGGISLRLDVGALERRITARLMEAVELAPSRRRGRPPRAQRKRQTGAGE